jgi:hypothetical protein
MPRQAVRPDAPLFIHSKGVVVLKPFVFAVAALVSASAGAKLAFTGPGFSGVYDVQR